MRILTDLDDPQFQRISGVERRCILGAQQSILSRSQDERGSQHQVSIPFRQCIQNRIHLLRCHHLLEEAYVVIRELEHGRWRVRPGDQIRAFYFGLYR